MLQEMTKLGMSLQPEQAFRVRHGGRQRSCEQPDDFVLFPDNSTEGLHDEETLPDCTGRYGRHATTARIRGELPINRA